MLLLRYVSLLTALFVLVSPWKGVGQTLYTPGRMPSQPPSKNRYKISGTVVNSATGEPVGRAKVQINGSASQQVFTDGSGRFEMSDVPEGQIVVSAQRPGFINSEMTGHRSPMIPVGPATPSIQVKLIPEGIIKGKTTNNEGEPVESVNVQVLFQQISNGRKDWLPRGGTNTDENGEYQIEDLPPGQYLLHTSVSPLFPMNMAAENGPLTEIYPLQYFPNAPTQDSAQSIIVQPGQAAEADFRLSPVPSYSISGSVSGPQDTSVSCNDADGNTLGFGRINHRTNQFKLVHIPSGSCTLTFHSQHTGGQIYFAEQPVTVNSSNITDIQAALQPLPDIAIHFSSSTGGMPVQLHLVPRQKHWRGGQVYPMMQGGQSDSQTPAFKGVPPGSYKVVAHNLNNSCIGSLSSGGTDLLREDLTVVSGSAQAASIEVSLRTDCATLTGTMNANSPPVNVSAIVVPGSAGMEPKLVFASNGNFVLPGLAPGEYTVYAFSDISDLEYANPEALREFSGQKISVGPNEKATVQLNLITRGDSK